MSKIEEFLSSVDADNKRPATISEVLDMCENAYITIPYDDENMWGDSAYAVLPNGEKVKVLDISSWRGDYSCLQLALESCSDDREYAMYFRDILPMFRGLSKGCYITGYKGGNFHVGSETDVYASRRGHCDRFTIENITTERVKEDLKDYFSVNVYFHLKYLGAEY